MDRSEHLLTCLAEECGEVSQRVMKALRFGLAEVQTGQSLNNAERIEEELRDLISVAQILHEDGILSKKFAPTPIERETKRAKIERYMAIGFQTGALSHPGASHG